MIRDRVFKSNFQKARFVQENLPTILQPEEADRCSVSEKLQRGCDAVAGAVVVDAPYKATDSIVRDLVPFDHNGEGGHGGEFFDGSSDGESVPSISGATYEAVVEKAPPKVANPAQKSRVLEALDCYYHLDRIMWSATQLSKMPFCQAPSAQVKLSRGGSWHSAT
ncbi:hypothetical protein PoB_005865300 [Plakobranchus ocellatus]|uniref:Uncharacterized protein n=1 Tax=Plakobranchus ocellatus TaxID=259542 RepID=A0AAV4CKH2_9GAST|nr:hypothetical protein PoB_005865300 [Plakobranchus ocellatus]